MFTHSLTNSHSHSLSLSHSLTLTLSLSLPPSLSLSLSLTHTHTHTHTHTFSLSLSPSSNLSHSSLRKWPLNYTTDNNLLSTLCSEKKKKCLHVNKARKVCGGACYGQSQNPFPERKETDSIFQ